MTFIKIYGNLHPIPTDIKTLLISAQILVGILLMTFSASSQSGNKKKEQLPSPDSLWIQFATKMETNDFEFLVKNSLDTIQCADCNLDGNPGNEFYEAKVVFSYHMSKLTHIDSLLSKNYNIYQNDTLMHVVYNIKTRNALEGGYNLIFNFIKKEKRYLFQGMIVTP